MKRKLLVIGSNTIHVYNFITLIEEYFDEVLLITNKINQEREVQALEMDFSLGVNSWKTVKNIRNVLKEYQPSVVHIQQANTYAFLATLAAKKFSIPLIVTAWGSDVLLNPKKNYLLKKMLQYVLDNAAAITADSNHVLNSAQDLVKKKLSLHNINFGIVISDCPNQDKKKIIYSNRLHKDLYNIDKIIYSFEKFSQENANWKLVIAGSGENTKKLRKLVRELNIEKSVEFVGFLNQQDNYNYYCQSKIYVSVPKSDSISISLVEAMIFGCIPFVSNLEANKELIEDAKNGFIVDDLEHIDFSKYLEVEMNDFEKVREELKVTFSKEHNKNRYIEIYKEVIR